MRILIDECLNWRPSRALTGHYAVSAQKMGWAELKNSVLLIEAEKQFAVFITGDLNVNFQQDVTKHHIVVVVLHAESTQLHHTLPLMPKVLALLTCDVPEHRLKRGDVVVRKRHRCVFYKLKVSVVEECVFDRGQVTHRINLFDKAMKYGDVIPLRKAIDYVRGLPDNLDAPAL